MKIKIIVLILFFLICTSVIYAQILQDQIRSEHFIVYFDQRYVDFAKEVSAQAEKYYRWIAKDLGYVRYSNFWKWDNRVKIYIYPDHQTYLKATNQQMWSHGIADYTKKEIISYLWAEEFLDRLLAHEIAHLVFRDFVGFKGEVPLWLDEGIAQWEEKVSNIQRKQLVKQLFKQGMLFSLTDMMRMDIRQIKQDEQVSVHPAIEEGKKRKVLVITGQQMVSIYYLQAFSLVGFLIEQYTPEKFVIFSRQLRKGKDIDHALRYTYPAQIRSIEQLEHKWLQYLENM